MNLAFDTLTAAKKMEEVGMERVQAEVISHIIAERQGDLVTKADIADMVTKADIADMVTKADIADFITKADIADLITRAEFRADMADMKADMADMKADMADMKAVMADMKEVMFELKGDIKSLKESSDWQKKVILFFLMPAILTILLAMLGAGVTIILFLMNSPGV